MPVVDKITEIEQIDIVHFPGKEWSVSLVGKYYKTAPTMIEAIYKAVCAYVEENHKPKEQ